MGSQQRFCLRWNNHQSNLLNVFDELLQHETLVDVTLACEGQSLKAHKVVLSACSPYFQHLFLDNPCQHPIVILKDVSFTDMKILIDFMYKGEVDISHDQLSTLLTVADNLKVKGLAEVKESMAAQETNSANHYHHQTQSEMSNTQYTRTSPSRDGPSSPKRRKKRRASSVSTTHSDDLDSCGAKEITSRSSTPVELPIVPKTETFDMSYEDEEKPLGTVLENSPPSLLASTNTNSQHSNISHESSSQLAYHLSRPQKDSTTMSRVRTFSIFEYYIELITYDCFIYYLHQIIYLTLLSDMRCKRSFISLLSVNSSQVFETDSGDVDCGLPFTQHLSVDADDTPPSSTPLVLLPSTPLVLLPPTSSTSHTDSSSTCLASTSSLNHTNVASVSSASQSRNLHSQGKHYYNFIFFFFIHDDPKSLHWLVLVIM